MVTYSTIESLTGGALATLFTSQDGASEYYNGGMIVYSDSIKAQLGINTDSPYDSKDMAESLAKHTYIDADIVVSTTGYIDRSYAYCILVSGKNPIVRHVVLTEEQLKLPRDQRQCDIARYILQDVFVHTRDVHLITSSGLLSRADRDCLTEMLFQSQVKDNKSYVDTVKAIAHTDKIMDRIPDLLASMPDLASLLRRAASDETTEGRVQIIKYLLNEFLLVEDIDSAVDALAMYLVFEPVTDSCLYYINTFDDGYLCCESFTNEWIRTHSNYKGKVSLCNAHDETVCIPSISEWKVNKIEPK